MSHPARLRGLAGSLARMVETESAYHNIGHWAWVVVRPRGDSPHCASRTSFTNETGNMVYTVDPQRKPCSRFNLYRILPVCTGIPLYNLCAKHSPRPLKPQGRLLQSVRKSSSFIRSNVLMHDTLNSRLTSGKWRFARMRLGLDCSFVTTQRFWTSARA